MGAVRDRSSALVVDSLAGRRSDDSDARLRRHLGSRRLPLRKRRLDLECDELGPSGPQDLLARSELGAGNPLRWNAAWGGLRDRFRHDRRRSARRELVRVDRHRRLAEPHGSGNGPNVHSPTGRPRDRRHLQYPGCLGENRGRGRLGTGDAQRLLGRTGRRRPTRAERRLLRATRRVGRCERRQAHRHEMIPTSIIPFLILLVLLLGYGIIEFHRHHVRLSYIPTRVHVNGTRGKSSVSRLIYGALREAGFKVAGKTTGTHPRYLDVMGVEHEIPRVGKPNIKEQILTTRRAFQEHAQAIVFECMALQAEAQSLSEDRILRATVGVITNVRLDHLDVMGPTIADVARTLARTVPTRGVLFTAETDPASLAILEEAARKKGTRVVGVEATGVTEAELSGFSYFEHAE